MSGLARYIGVCVVFVACAADIAAAATCCVSSAETCPATECGIPNVGGQCPIEALSKDCGGPYYCSFDPALGCLTTNPCTAAKLKAVSRAVQLTLKCDAKADANGLAVDAACTGAALSPLAGAFSLADAMGSCPGTAATAQNDIAAFESNLNAAVGNAAAVRTASKCDSERVAAMGVMAARWLGCMSKTAREATSPFPCIHKADDQAAHVTGAAERRGGCSNANARNELQDAALDVFLPVVSDHLATP